jgi:hypothetical protein
MGDLRDATRGITCNNQVEYVHRSFPRPRVSPALNKGGGVCGTCKACGLAEGVHAQQGEHAFGGGIGHARVYANPCQGRPLQSTPGGRPGHRRGPVQPNGKAGGAPFSANGKAPPQPPKTYCWRAIASGPHVYHVRPATGTLYRPKHQPAK